MKLLIPLIILFFYITPLGATSLDLGTSYDLGVIDSNTLSLSAETEIQKLVSVYTPEREPVAELDLDDPITLSTEIQYGETRDDIIKNNGFVRAGYDPGLNEDWSLWFYEEVRYNHVTEVNVENFAGGGIKYKLFSNASISFGNLYHYLEIDTVKSIDYKHTNRWSLRLKIKSSSMSKSSSAGMVVFYQPNMVDFEDYILKGEAYLKRKLDNKFFLKFSVKDQYRTNWNKNEFSSILSVGIEL